LPFLTFFLTTTCFCASVARNRFPFIPIYLLGRQRSSHSQIWYSRDAVLNGPPLPFLPRFSSMFPFSNFCSRKDDLLRAVHFLTSLFTGWSPLYRPTFSCLPPCPFYLLLRDVGRGPSGETWAPLSLAHCGRAARPRLRISLGEPLKAICAILRLPTLPPPLLTLPTFSQDYQPAAAFLIPGRADVGLSFFSLPSHRSAPGPER